MKTDKNSIDELFKEGLGNFTQQPSTSLWRRISWQMLRFEISHFNFTNISTAWILAPAAAIVIFSVVAVYNYDSLTSSETSPVTEQLQPGSDNSNRNETDLRTTIDPNGTNKNDATADGNLESLNTGSAPEKQSSSDIQISRNDDRIKQLVEADTKIEKIAIEEKVSKNQNASAQGNPTSSENQKFTITNYNSSAVIISESGLAEAIAAPAVSSHSSAGDFISESQVIAEMPAIETALSTLKRKELINLVPLTTEEKYLFFHGANYTLYESNWEHHSGVQKVEDKDVHETGRVQRLNSINSSLALFLRGSYKPPKRDLNSQLAKNSKRKTSHLSLAAYVSPEITEYSRVASSSRERSIAGGIAVGYNTPVYILQAGVEVSYLYDRGDYMTNFGTYDSIGYYEHVNGFIIDPLNPGNIIYDTHQVAVWDSVEHVSHQQTQNSYTYLQFPVMIGYKAFERGLFSAYIKAGPNFSIMLDKNEPSPDFYQPGATIHSIENYTLPRSSANVQILMSIGLHLQATEKFGFLAEPYYRYYFGNVYDGNNSGTIKNPYGLGIRAGAFYTF